MGKINIYIKSSKKYIALVLAITIMLTALPISVLANETDYYDPEIDLYEALSEERELTEDEFYYLIDVMEEYISYEEGEIVIDGNFESLTEYIGEDAVEDMIEGVEYLNELAEDDELIITENGTIFEYDNDEFTLQARRNRVTRHWWGVRLYTCRANTIRAFRELRARGERVGFAGALTALLGFGLGGVAVAAGGFSLVLATAMENRNRGHTRGIRTSIPWIPAGFSTARQ